MQAEMNELWLAASNQLKILLAKMILSATDGGLTNEIRRAVFSERGVPRFGYRHRRFGDAGGRLCAVAGLKPAPIMASVKPLRVGAAANLGTTA
jgi:hypothetical protein